MIVYVLTGKMEIFSSLTLILKGTATLITSMFHYKEL